MKPEEIKSLVQETVKGKTKNFWIYILLSAIIGVASAYSTEFFKNKAQNLATKQDIEEITRKIEDVKAQIENQQEIEKQKRQLKYDALLNSLTLIDAHLSQVLIPNKDQKIKKQFSTVEEARKCHNNLILTCENTEVLDLFSRIMFGPKNKTEEEPPTVLLNKYRNMIRKELGFGSELKLDEDRAWIGWVNFEK